MTPQDVSVRDPFRMEFDIGTIKHLGLQMYSTLPPVIGELVANAWDANARNVEVTIPTAQFDDDSEIVVSDDGDGMTDAVVRKAYMVVGRDRREATGKQSSGGELDRPVMGRKGIGKFAGFGIAAEIEVESVCGQEQSRWIMNYEALQNAAEKREILFPVQPPSGTVAKGTRVALRKISRFRTKSVNIDRIRRGLARRFSVIGPAHDFQLSVNGSPITVEERDLKRLLGKDSNGEPYLWTYENDEIVPESGWTVSGWIGALDRTAQIEDGIQRGIALLARGKLVQEPFVFDATVGQQFALSYIIGELTVEFVDGSEDTVGTTRNSLVWDTEANSALLEWGRKEVNRIAREWAEKRSSDNEKQLEQNELYQRFKNEAAQSGNSRALKVADKLIRDVVKRNILQPTAEQEQVVQLCLDFLEFDAFWDLAEDISSESDPLSLSHLFRDWEIVEAKEMARVTQGRITTIEKLSDLIETNALEVPTLHAFLKEFPWVLDPRWTLVADEVHYSKLLRERFPEGDDILEGDRRIDFLCVRENNQLIVVEIKRPQSHASKKELDQIRDYVVFVRSVVEQSTDSEARPDEVIGYLLCGKLVNVPEVRVLARTLRDSKIHVREYSDLLRLVENSHKEFLEKYEALKKLKAKEASNSSDSK
jgi:hypothetical protein